MLFVVVVSISQLSEGVLTDILEATDWQPYFQLDYTSPSGKNCSRQAERSLDESAANSNRSDGLIGPGTLSPQSMAHAFKKSYQELSTNDDLKIDDDLKPRGGQTLWQLRHVS